MILFFHIICLVTQYIVDNLTKSISKYKETSDDDSMEENNSSHEVQMSIPSEHSGFINKCSHDDGDLRFFPPVYVQRYEAVANILKDSRWNPAIRKVVDFGCAELGFFMHLKNISNVEVALEVDIDEDLLLRFATKAAPLRTDYLSSRRSTPLNVYLLAGSICDYDEHLKDIDAVVAIEIIEHLTNDVLKKMPYNIFHRIKPRLAIFTTPNSEFNVLFPNMVGFRHDDHKFEWTRKEFYDWAQDVLATYPGYSVKFYGIGAGPDGTENLGCCSQMAVFERTEAFQGCSDQELKDVKNYKLIREYDYPYHVDKRTDREKIVDEIYSRTCQFSTVSKFYNYDDCIAEIPLSLIMEYVQDWCSSIDELKTIVESIGMTVAEKNNNLVVIYSNEPIESDYSQDWSDEETNETVNEPQPIPETEDWWDDDAKFQMDKKISSGFWEGVPNTPSEMFSQPNNRSVIDFSIPELEKNIEIFKNETEEPDDVKRKKDIQSKIPRKRNFREAVKKKLSPLGSPRKQSSLMKPRVRPYSSHIYKSPKKISKSCSLDSCLENINCESIEVQAFYLNLITSGAGASSSNSCKFLTNDLNSVDSEKAADSGYPFSFSPHDADLTPEQVDELVTENEILASPKSSISEDSLSEEGDEGVGRVVHDLFVEDEIVENGDLANNNRDGEGNNVEGLAGERLANQIPILADPNDNNILFIPDGENPFPEWLLNLVELAQNPVI